MFLYLEQNEKKVTLIIEPSEFAGSLSGSFYVSQSGNKRIRTWMCQIYDNILVDDETVLWN